MANVKDTAKSVIKNKIKKSKAKLLLLKFGLPLIGIIIASAAVLAIMGQLIKTASNIISALNISKTITSIYHDGGITDDNIDDYLNQLIKQLHDKGLTMQDLGMAANKDMTPDEEKQAKYYIKEYLTASLVTEIVNSNKQNPNIIPGGVNLQRHNAKTNKIDKLQYSDTLSLYTFTVDGSGNIQYLNADGTTATIDKSTYQSQAIPVMFFIDICIVTQNPEYVKALADYIIDNAKNGEPYMEVTILDTCIDTTTTTTTTTHPSDGNLQTTNTPTTTTTPPTTTSSQTSSLMATKVNSLLYKEEQKYHVKKSTEGPTTTNWKNGNTDYSSTTTTTTYSFENEGTPQSTIYDTVDKDTNPFYKITAQSYENPNDGLCESGYYKLTKGADWLFKFMDEDQTLADNKNTNILKYILYKWTGTSYGVTKIDASWFDLDNFNNVSTIYGSNVQEKVWFALRDAGFSEIATAGVMGNIDAESSFTPSAQESGGTGIGIMQWSFGRHDALVRYAQSKGTTWQDVNTQIEFLLTEVTGQGKASGFANYQLGSSNNGYSINDFKNAENPSDAAAAFCWIYERPYAPTAHLERRQEAAMKYYQEFKGKTRPNGGSGQAVNGDGYTQVYTSSTGQTYKLYKQYIGSYANMQYYTYGPISSEGCSITSIACVLSGFKVNINPGNLCNNPNLADDLTSKGVKCNGYEAVDKAKLMSGRPAIVSISGTLKIGGTSKYYAGHFVAILDARGTDEVYVNDVGSYTSGWAKVEDIMGITTSNGVLYTY